MGLQPHIDLRAIAFQAMATYGFYAKFPPSVLREVQAFSNIFNGQKWESPTRDLRHLLWSSIDNVDSRDLDQIEYCERVQGREIRVLVGIADVDAYVTKGTLTDRHAGHNGTSVYTGVETFPMIPERLCTDLSSLNYAQDRLAMVIEFFVRRDGNVRPGEIFPALVHNRAKLIYEEIGEWLQGERDLPAAVIKVDGLEDQLRLQDEAAQRLHQFRMEKGALELEMIEPRPVMMDGTVRDLVIAKKNRARFLIENFMVAANGTMVAFFEKNNRPHIQRVVRTPERWPRICEVALSLGDPLPPEPDSRALSEFLARRRQADPDHFPDLSLTIVKLLGSGEYVLAEPGKVKLGHFGLAVQDYTHSTAPNRRYVDIVTQRIIKSILAKETNPYTKRELQEIAVWCTERDQNAKKVERFVRKVAGAMLLSGRIGEIFDGIVTGASEKGTYVRLLHPPVEGRVVRGESGMDVGERVRVQLLDIDFEKGFIDFEGYSRTPRDYRYPQGRLKRKFSKKRSGHHRK